MVFDCRWLWILSNRVLFRTRNRMTATSLTCPKGIQKWTQPKGLTIRSWQCIWTAVFIFWSSVSPGQQQVSSEVGASLIGRVPCWRGMKVVAVIGHDCHNLQHVHLWCTVVYSGPTLFSSVPQVPQARRPTKIPQCAWHSPGALGRTHWAALCTAPLFSQK